MVMRILNAITLVSLLTLFSGHVFAADVIRKISDPNDITSYFTIWDKEHIKPAHTAEPRKRADFGKANKSWEAQKFADWVVDSGDNNHLPFVIVDKKDAKVFVFDPDGKIVGSSAALLGIAHGDDSSPGIGTRSLREIRRKERTTPAGRFVGTLGYNTDGKDVLWVDYDNAVSLHRVITDEPRERRLQRLATSTPLDNRISYGCINVPKKFYEDVIRPVFNDTSGVIYILPETRPAGDIFESYYDVDP
ncbi:MAG: hypothetical protein ABFD12_02925 [Syntrophorhabdus sp.]